MAIFSNRFTGKIQAVSLGMSKSMTLGNILGGAVQSIVKATAAAVANAAANTPAKAKNTFTGVASTTLPSNNDPDLIKAIEGLKTAERYAMVDAPINDSRQLSLINRFHMQPPAGQLGTHGFIFMTRPNLNLFETDNDGLNSYSVKSSAKIHPNLNRLAPFSYIYRHGMNEDHRSSDAWLGKRIYASLCNFGSRGVDNIMNSSDNYRTISPWLSIITNQAVAYNPPGREIDTVEVSQTFHGNKVIYAEPTFKHKTGGTITVEFQDRRDLSLYYTLKLWIEYIQAVTTGLASPYRKYICQGILDYAVAMYYVVTDETMENILYWEKLTGVFPLTVPDDMWAMTAQSGDVKDLKYSINFAYSMRTVQSEGSLLEINAQYGITTDEHRFGMATSSIDVSTDLSDMKTLDKYIATIANVTMGDTEKAYISMYKQVYGSAFNNSEDFKRYFSIGNKQKAKLFPNYLPEIHSHGVPYVNGPFITMGTNAHEVVGSNIDYLANQDFNKDQYKLRWV